MTQARLPATARLLLAEVHRKIKIGTWGRISNAWFAQALGISESTVSRGMALLAAHNFILRRERQDGRPGFETCPLPPPELRPKPARAARPAEPAPMRQGALFDPSIIDPVESIPFQPVPTPQIGIDMGSTVDGPIFYDQTCMRRHACADAPLEPQPDSPPPQAPEPDRAIPAHAHVPPAPAAPRDEPGSHPPTRAHVPPAQLPDELPPQLAALGLHPHHWRLIVESAANAPAGYGPTDLTRDLLKIRTRRDIHNPVAFLRRAIERGEPIFDQAEIDAQNAELAARSGRPPRKDTPHAPPDRPARRSPSPPPERPAGSGPPPGLKLARLRSPGAGSPDGGEPPGLSALWDAPGHAPG